MKPSARRSPLRRPHPCSTNDIFKQCLFFVFVGVVVVAAKQEQRPFRIPFSKYTASCNPLDITRILFLNVGNAVIIRVLVGWLPLSASQPLKIVAYGVRAPECLKPKTRMRVESFSPLRPVAVLIILAVLSGLNLTDGIGPGGCLLSLPEHHWNASFFKRPPLESTGSAILKFWAQAKSRLYRQHNSTKAACLPPPKRTPPPRLLASITLSYVASAFLNTPRLLSNIAYPYVAS